MPESEPGSSEPQKPKLGEKVRTALGKLWSLRRRNYLREEDFLLSHDEPITQQFPLVDYHYWREGFQQLQVGSHYDSTTDRLEDLVLSGETKESSSNIGWSANNITRRTISELREGRLDASGQPYVLCVDEVSDAQVLQNAPVADREECVKRGILNIIDRVHFPAGDFLTAAVVTTSILTGRKIIEAIKFVQQATMESNLEPSKKSNFTQELQKLSNKRIKQLLTFIKGSKSRLIGEEKSYTAKHGPRKYGSFEEAYEASAETGEPLFTARGEEFSAPHASRERYVLSKEDTEMILPLREAIHRSRHEMVRQARLAAVRYLGLEPDPTYHASPPEWWVNREKTEGLRSDEVLVFVPYRVSEDKKAKYPPLLRKSAGGWSLLKIPYDADGNMRLRMVKKLTS